MASKDKHDCNEKSEESLEVVESEKSKNSERAVVLHEYTEEDLLGPFIGLKIDLKPICAESLWQIEDEKLSKAKNKNEKLIL